MYPAILQTIACNLRNRPEKYSVRTISNLLGMSKSTIHRWINLRMKSGKVKRIGSLFSYQKVIRKYMEENPNCRLKDVKVFLEEQHGKHISLSTICRHLRLLGISYKKVTLRNYTNWERLIEQRKAFEEEMKTIPKSAIVSLDESYFYKRMIRSYGYSKVGEKCLVKNRVGMKKYRLLLAISMKEILTYEVETCNFNRHNFYSFLSKKLLPMITDKVILMDNASFHKCKEIVNLIHTSGNRILFIPPYSQYNPMEIVFRMMKSRLCVLVEINHDDIPHVLDSISGESLKRIFQSCLG